MCPKGVLWFNCVLRGKFHLALLNEGGGGVAYKMEKPNVIFVQEPSNLFDTNSILVILASKNREVLGHLEHSVAAGIAELMDKFKSQVKIVGYAG